MKSACSLRILLAGLTSITSLSVLTIHGTIPLRAPPPTDLKLLCAGDSITYGIGDHLIADNIGDGTNNGFRLYLHDFLVKDGLRPVFIGTQVSGLNNPQPYFEGYGMHTINAILEHLKHNSILAERPDVVLIHAGTNDMAFGNDGNDDEYNYSHAPIRLEGLVDYVLEQAPDAIVLVAMLISNKFAQEVTNEFNRQVPHIVEKRREEGHKIRVVDMSTIGDDQLSDLMHPTRAGYEEMAQRWHSAIMRVPSNWWRPTSDTGNGVLLSEWSESVRQMSSEVYEKFRNW